MTRAQFRRLRQGDRIRLNGTFRTVLHGPGDNPPTSKRCSIILPKLSRSWTGRPTTVYGWNDIKHRISGPYRPRSKSLLNGHEFERLLCQGFSNPALALQIDDVEHHRTILRVDYGFDL